MSPWYRKNLPALERWIRFAAGGLVAALAWWQLGTPWNLVGALSGLGLGLTGVVGFCPACAMLDRRLRS